LHLVLRLRGGGKKRKKKNYVRPFPCSSFTPANLLPARRPPPRRSSTSERRSRWPSSSTTRSTLKAVSSDCDENALSRPVVPVSSWLGTRTGSLAESAGTLCLSSLLVLGRALMDFLQFDLHFRTRNQEPRFVKRLLVMGDAGLCAASLYP
jgi:hypothetical protein